MAVKITFEGFCDTRAGWKFDAPLFLVKPVMQMHDVGSSTAEADRIVEEYVMSLSLGDTPESDEELDRRMVLRCFRKAKDGSSRYEYWSQSVEIPDDIDWDSVDAFERVTYGALQIGTAAQQDGGTHG